MLGDATFGSPKNNMLDCWECYPSSGVPATHTGVQASVQAALTAEPRQGGSHGDTPLTAWLPRSSLPSCSHMVLTRLGISPTPSFRRAPLVSPMGKGTLLLPYSASPFKNLVSHSCLGKGSVCGAKRKGFPETRVPDPCMGNPIPAQCPRSPWWWGRGSLFSSLPCPSIFSGTGDT